MNMLDQRKTTVAVIAAVSVIGSSIALYALLQRAQPVAVVPQVAGPSSPGGPAAEARPLDQMADRLAARLANEGGTAADWALLGRSYREMGRWPEAVKSFEKSLSLGTADPQVQADLDAARAKVAVK